MLLGYMRVSKADGSQLLDLQRDALLAAGVAEERLYEDRASGRRDDRPGLVECLKALQPGNTLTVWKLDRLGRDLRHLVELVDRLRRAGVGLKVLTGAGAEIDTTTPNGRLIFGIFASLAEYERELIAERTRAGLAAARARGRLGGRPRKMDRQTVLMAMHAMGDPATSAKDPRPAARDHDHHALRLRQRRRHAEGRRARPCSRGGRRRRGRANRLVLRAAMSIAGPCRPWDRGSAPCVGLGGRTP